MPDNSPDVNGELAPTRLWGCMTVCARGRRSLRGLPAGQCGGRGPFGVPPSGGSRSLPAQPAPLPAAPVSPRPVGLFDPRQRGTPNRYAARTLPTEAAIAVMHPGCRVCADFRAWKVPPPVFVARASCPCVARPSWPCSFVARASCSRIAGRMPATRKGETPLATKAIAKLRLTMPPQRRNGLQTCPPAGAPVRPDSPNEF